MGDATAAGRIIVSDAAELAAVLTDGDPMYSYPRRSERSLRWVAVHTLHEVRHHLADVRRQLP